MLRNTRHHVLPITALQTIALLFCTSAVVAQGHGPTPVRIAEVRQERLQDMRRVNGELRAVARSRVATIEPGLVLEMPVDEGQLIEGGDILAVLDSRRLKLSLQRLEARRRVAEAIVSARSAEKELEQRDLDTLQTLESRGASMPKELSDAIAQLAVADAREAEASRELESIQVDVDLIETRLADMTITAPFSGVVTEIFTERGQWVGEGEAILEIVAVDEYDAWLNVPQALAETVMGGRAKVQVDVEPGGVSFPAAEARVVPMVDSSARTFPVYVRIQDGQRRLASGMAVVGWVPSGEEAEHLTLPRDALLRNEAGFYVYVARAQGEGPAMAAPAPVQILFAHADRVAVRSGALQRGDLVVVEGNERLFPMMPIAFELPAPPANEVSPGGADAGDATEGQR